MTATERPSAEQAELDLAFHRHVCRAWAARVRVTCNECDALEDLWLDAVETES